MNNFKLTTYLTSNVGADREEIEKLLEHCTLRSYKKGEFLLMEGQKCEYSFFVESGLLRQYSVDAKGKEHIIQFAPENWFMLDRGSAYFDLPSSYYIQALEDTTAFLLKDSLFVQLAETDASFFLFNTKLLHNHIRHLQRRITQLQSASAEERYLDFIRLFPDLMLRVPQAYIASYLGIAPESLSRVRKELAQRHRGPFLT